jgi:hypothetical protein
MKSIFKVFKKAFSSTNAQILEKTEKIEKLIKSNNNSLTVNSTQITTSATSPKVIKKHLMCSYKNILYQVEAKKSYFTTKDLLQVFSITGKSSNQSYRNYDLVYKNKYMKHGRDVFPFISDLNENNPLFIYDEKLSEEYFVSRNMNLKEYNSNFQFYVDKICSNKLPNNNPNLIDVQKLENYKKTHEDILNNPFHYQTYLKLFFSNFRKRLTLKQNLEIKSKLNVSRTLPYAFICNSNIIPFDLTHTKIFNQNMESLKDQSELNKALWPRTYNSFDNLRTIARNDSNPDRKYYLGVITDLLCWKFTFYIKNKDYSLENEGNFLSSRVYLNNSFDYPFINEMLNFTYNLVEEKENFAKYKV